MVERKYIVSGGVNGQNSPLMPIPKAEERQVKSNSARWKWLGIQNKTFWDWMGLLLVPILLLAATVILDRQAREREENATKERNKQEVLQNYLLTMTDLISRGKLLGENKAAAKGTSIAAKALTQSALGDLKGDADRKAQVLTFLYDAELVTYDPSTYAPRSKEQPIPIIDMVTIDLSEANLQGTVFGPPDKKPAIILSSANLANANLNYSKLGKAQMQMTRLKETQLKAADLKDANLERANLEGANLEGANLEGAKLSYANLTNANLEGANLGGSQNIDSVKLSGATLKGADLRGANLANANLNNADLTQADLTDAKMKTAEMVGATLCQTTMPEGTVDNRGCPEQAK